MISLVILCSIPPLCHSFYDYGTGFGQPPSDLHIGNVSMSSWKLVVIVHSGSVNNNINLNVKPEFQKLGSAVFAVQNTITFQRYCIVWNPDHPTKTLLNSQLRS